jgi:hypothetical protein
MSRTSHIPTPGMPVGQGQRSHPIETSSQEKKRFHVPLSTQCLLPLFHKQTVGIEPPLLVAKTIQITEYPHDQPEVLHLGSYSAH